MPRPIGVAAAATLHVHGVPIQPNHRHPTGTILWVGEGRIGQPAQHRPLVQPPHLPGRESSEPEMLGQLLFQHARLAHRCRHASPAGRRHRGTEDGTHLRSRHPEPVDHPSACAGLGQPDRQHPPPLVHRLGDEPSRNTAGYTGPPRRSAAAENAPLQLVP